MKQKKKSSTECYIVRILGLLLYFFLWLKGKIIVYYITNSMMDKNNKNVCGLRMNCKWKFILSNKKFRKNTNKNSVLC